MKKKYTLSLITGIFAIGFTIGATGANASALAPTPIEIENSEKWIEVQNKNGIKIYFLEYDLNQDTYLKIKFENLSEESVDFNWTLSNKKAEKVMNNVVIGLKPNGTTETIHSAHAILLKSGESIADYSVQITVK